MKKQTIIKTASLALVIAFVLCSMLACSSPVSEPVKTPIAEQSSMPGQPANNTSVFVPGKYIGEAQGCYSVVTMEVEVDKDKIIAINVVSHGETAGTCEPAFDKVPKQIIEDQSVAVDVVTGCTISSYAVISAVTKALEQSGADMTVLKTAKELEVPTQLIIESADVVIVGAGGAGLNAAVEALRANASVIVIEKIASVGGQTKYISAINASNSEVQKKSEMTATEMAAIKEVLATEPKNDLMKKWRDTLAKEIAEYEAAGSTYLFDSPSLHKLQTYIGGDYIGDPKIIGIYGDNSLGALQFLTDLGAVFLDGVNAANGATWCRSYTPSSENYARNGLNFVLPQYEFAQANGADFMLDSKAEELILDESGRVTGVRGTTRKGQPFEVTANNGVILTTGGFGANVEMRQKYNKRWPTLDASIGTTNSPHATGDGIVMAEAVGANLVGMEHIQLMSQGSGLVSTYIDNMIFVNNNGERFVNEDARRDVMSAAILSLPGGKAWVISDCNTVIDGVSTSGQPVQTNVERGTVKKAETLEELAVIMGVPIENLLATVESFNGYVEDGGDPFGRSVFDQEFGKGPFYAGDLFPVVHHTMGGIEINTSCEVLDTSGNVIPGLYAAGETAGGLHGGNRLGGNAGSDIIVFGRIAGQNAAITKP